MKAPQRKRRRELEGELKREEIVQAAEDALRRYGPAKATVIDVARALGVSHGSVYRHFESKAALISAVVEGWLLRLSVTLDEVARQPGTAQERLRGWLNTLRELKMHRYQQEAELFATYHQLMTDSREAVRSYYDALTRQLQSIIAAGVASGEFRSSDVMATTRAIFDATIRFHHPWHAADWHEPGIDTSFENLWTLILYGISTDKPA